MNINANASTCEKTASPSLPAAAHSPGLHERLLLRLLSRLRRGHLRVILPSGRQLHFGAPQDETWHAGTRAPAALAIPEQALVEIHDPAFFKRCVLFGDIGFAEAFMDGLWTSPDLRAVIAWFILNIEELPGASGSRAARLGTNLLRSLNRLGHLLRPNSVKTASRNIREHYDLSNEFFSLWLDPTMMYSSARWTTPGLSLTEAQTAKNEALCSLLRLKPEDHVLEIGTGWGGWCIHAAATHGCRVTSLTISPAQRELALKRVREAGLQDRIEVKLLDYRLLPADARFDKLVSIEMLEAVGHDYLEDWCATVSRVLKKDGLMALQFITCPDGRYEQMRKGVDFIQKHVFPGSLLLSLNRLSGLLAKQGNFSLGALEDFGQDYARTLGLWRENFEARTREIRELGFDDRFQRKWHYYLAYCEAAFALRNISVVHALYSRPNNLSH